MGGALGCFGAFGFFSDKGHLLFKPPSEILGPSACVSGGDRQMGMMVGNKLKGFPGSPEIGVPAPDEMLILGQ